MTSTQDEAIHDVIVLGAGIAGLTCARELARSGADVLVLDRADKAGGRCATRVFGDVRADYGPLFLHGDDPVFLEAVAASVPLGRMEGWPRRVRGTGTPCQPRAFTPRQRRFGMEGGVNAFAQSLAQGLNLRLGTQAASAAVEAGTATVRDAAGGAHRGRDLVFALALEQSLPFLRGLPPGRERDGALSLLGMFSTVPCLTVIAGYSDGTRRPDWDVWYPEESRALLMVGNESSKRPGTPGHCLVLQALPRWSREHLEEPKETWSARLLEEAVGLMGSWVAKPEWRHPHRWRYARLDPSNELASGLLLDLGGSRVAVVGDLYSPGGGVQAAWRSGRHMAVSLATKR